MKKFFTFVFALSFFSVSYAQSNITSGFYRVNNVATERYVYVHDNVGEASVNGKIDLDAIYLRSGLENTISDPGSVIYFEDRGNKSFDFHAQGTSVYSILKRYVLITKNREADTYAVGAEVGGVRSFLTDSRAASKGQYGRIDNSSNGSIYWNVTPVSAESANFFGITPSVSANSKYYHPFYADFGIDPVSDNTVVYTVSQSNNYAVLLAPVTGPVAPKTPVVIECASKDPAQNKLNLSMNGNAVDGNKLVGNIFDTDNAFLFYLTNFKIHTNQLPVTSDMRFLSVDDKGQLVFSKTDLKTVPANSSYLKVASNASNDLIVCFTQEEYDAVTASSLDSFINDGGEVEVFNLLGKKVVNTRNLPAGIYIIGGKKTVIR
mgnify:CR=1 FL=1